MWLSTKDGWYMRTLHGVIYVTWVSEKDKAYATIFPKALIHGWVNIIQKMTEGIEVRRSRIMTDGTWCAMCRGEVKSYDDLCPECTTIELAEKVINQLRKNPIIDIDGWANRLAADLAKFRLQHK